MRDRAQLEMTVGQYQDAKRAERQRTLVQLERDLRAAREQGAEWYRWILECWRPYRLGRVAELDTRRR